MKLNNKRLQALSFVMLSAALPASANIIDIDFNSGVDIHGNSQGVLYFTGVDGFKVYFDDDNSNGAYGGDADGVHITNTNYGNAKVGTSDLVLGAYNASAGAYNYHSSGIVARFNQGASLVSFDDTDDDGTLKRLFAFDENGVLIAQSNWASRIPVEVIAPDNQLIYSVEFDTQVGSLGGSLDGTYFTIDNFHVEGVSSDTQIDIPFHPVPEPATAILLSLGLVGISRRWLNNKK